MKPAEPASARVTFEEWPPAHPVHRFAHAAMATTFEVLCVHPEASYARQAAHAAFALVDHLERQLSRFLANSDIARVNELLAGEGVRVSPETLECLAIARFLFDLTGGAFDVSIGTGLPHLELVADDFSVRAHKDGVRLDLGGIGKGYAVDLMADLLAEWDIHRALLHGGFSSVRALDPPPDQTGWPLTLSAPWPGNPRTLARISAHHLALSASGTRKGGHIVDPSTGRAATGKAAWVAVQDAARPEKETVDSVKETADSVEAAAPLKRLAPQLKEASASVQLTSPKPATMAEGLSTAFMLLPLEAIEGLCQEWPEIEAWLIQEPAEGEAPDAALLHVPTLDRPGPEPRTARSKDPRREAPN